MICKTGRARYIERAEWLDDVLYREVLQPIKTDPAFAKTYLLIVSDHGEEFLEHGGLFHGSTLYNESIQVPIILRDGLHQGIVHHPVAMRDAIQGIMTELGFSRSPKAAITLHSPFDRARPVLQIMGNTGEMALRQGDWKLIVNLRHASAILFNLKTDPGETDDLSGEQPEIVQRLLGMVDTEMRKMIKK